MLRFATFFAVAATLLAHHSVPAQFDVSKELIYQGTVESVAWMNPHATFTLKVATLDAKGQTWTFELPSPGHLKGQGLTQDSLKAGVHVSLTAFAAKDGRPLASAVRLTLGDRTYDVKDMWKVVSREELTRNRESQTKQ